MSCQSSRGAQGLVCGGQRHLPPTHPPHPKNISQAGGQKTRANISKQSGDFCIYMQTSLRLFIPFLTSTHDLRTLWNKTDLTGALISYFSLNFPSSVFQLRTIIFTSLLSFACLSSLFLICCRASSCEVVRLITAVQSLDSAVPRVIRRAVSLFICHPLSSPPPHLCSSSHSLSFSSLHTDCHPLTQS